MESSVTTSSAAADDGVAPPDSWEVADVDASMRRLMLSNRKDSSSTDTSSNQPETQPISHSSSGPELGMDDLINSVDQFLREAIQNPRERLSVLRMEQDVEKFIRDPTRDQMEFQQLPTSYLRLAAHRVAQHYSLQSMVLLDNNIPDGSSSRIIIRKASNIRLPSIRLADIPVNLPAEESANYKVAIKQRPKKGSNMTSNSNPNSAKSNSSKSVEERKEEYNRARARIFNNSSGSNGGSSSSKPEVEQPRRNDSFQHGITRAEERNYQLGGADAQIGRSLSDSSAVSGRLARSMPERGEAIVRPNANNKVAIIRDREVDRKDPDYNRSYDRYVQRFDPGFGFSVSPYPVQPLYAPALTYNTEFPQLGPNHGSPIPSEHQLRPVPQHLARPWAPPPSMPGGIGYPPAEPHMLSPFSPSHVNARSGSGLYLHHSGQYPPAGMQYMHPHEQIHQPFAQSPHQQQPDASFGLARPR